MTYRYAIYFAPDASSPLARFGTTWLGRDAATDKPVPPGELEYVTSEVWKDAVATAATYGFHGTLKPPFRLARPFSKEDLKIAVGKLAAGCAPVEMGRLQLTAIDGFLALTPQKGGDIAALAATCVEELDRFRAPPSADELAKRRASGLNDAQEAFLQRWGYPYVMDEFRFHLTLTRRLESETQRLFMKELNKRLGKIIRANATLDALSLFAQPGPGEPFTILERFPLAG